MYEWLVGILGEQYATYALYALAAVAVLFLLWILRFWFRRTPGGVFLGGGRGRQPRLAVVDAAAVDSHRRIVLLRRDNVEHLVMIGGHNDFVIERDIGKAVSPAEEGASPRTARPPQPSATEKQPLPAEKRTATVPAPAVAQQPQQHRPVESPERPAKKETPPPVRQPVTSPESVTPSPPKQEPAPAADEKRSETPQASPERREPRVDIASGQIRQSEPAAPQRESAQRAEPVVDVPATRQTHPQAATPDRNPDQKSLENEMEKLLAELSDDK